MVSPVQRCLKVRGAPMVDKANILPRGNGDVGESGS
jgi:hypothetical protein